MAMNLPPNLPHVAASAIVRQAEKPNPPSNAKRNRDEGRDAGNASIRRKNEPGTRR